MEASVDPRAGIPIVEINDFPDGRLEVRWKGRSLPYSAFDKLQRVSHAAIVENKRLLVGGVPSTRSNSTLLSPR
jgi:hypothetical protein